MSHRNTFLTMVALVVLGLSAPIHGEQRTVRLTPPPWQPGGCSTTNAPSCGYASAEDPAKLVVGFLHTNVDCVWFSDPVPPLSKVTSIDLRFGYASHLTFSQTPVNVHVYRPTVSPTPETLIGSFVRSNADSGFSCAPPYRQLLMQTVTGVAHPEGIAGYVYGGMNSLIFQETVDVEFIDIIMNFKRPPVVEFDVTSATTEMQRRVLIKQWRGDAFFSSEQAVLPVGNRDRRIRIAGTVKDEFGVVANQVVYLRAMDPPDVASYVPMVSRFGGDNAEGPGALDETTVTTNASGRFETVLTVTDNVSGDNYVVEGTTIPSFGGKAICDATNNCVKSGGFTAWKRMFVETDRMFRRGAMLTAHAVPCTGSACPGTVVLRIDDARRVRGATHLRLMHAPRFDGVGPGIFYSEDVNVVRVDTKAHTVEVSRPLNAYYGPDAVQPGVRLGFLADAVGVVTGGGVPADFYDVNVANVKDVMEPSYVDYVLLAGDDPTPVIPYRRRSAATGAVHSMRSVFLRESGSAGMVMTTFSICWRLRHRPTPLCSASRRRGSDRTTPTSS